MQPNYQARDTEHGIRYRGEALPLGPLMARQAQVDKANRFYTIMDNHEALRRKQRTSFYADLALLAGMLAVLCAVLVFLLRPRKR